jgi:cytochrome b subunit of formate dehydrogenase
MLSTLMVIWITATVILVGLLIYRALLSNKEDDQIFLGIGEQHMAQEQAALVGKMQMIGRYSLIVGIVSGVLLLVIAGLWTYQQLAQPLP